MNNSAVLQQTLCTPGFAKQPHTNRTPSHPAIPQPPIQVQGIVYNLHCLWHMPYCFTSLHFGATFHSATLRSITFIVRHKPRHPQKAQFILYIPFISTHSFISPCLLDSQPTFIAQSKSQSYISPFAIHYISFNHYPCFSNPQILVALRVFTPIANQRIQRTN